MVNAFSVLLLLSFFYQFSLRSKLLKSNPSSNLKIWIIFEKRSCLILLEDHDRISPCLVCGATRRKDLNSWQYKKIKQIFVSIFPSRNFQAESVKVFIFWSLFSCMRVQELRLHLQNKINKTTFFKVLDKKWTLYHMTYFHKVSSI